MSIAQYKEIFRLHSQRASQWGIGKSCECSRNTVACTVKNADRRGVLWQGFPDMSEPEVSQLLSPERAVPLEQ